ncbi:MAG: AAA family ATPase [Candidatus Latescibacterota bacterium]
MAEGRPPAGPPLLIGVAGPSCSGKSTLAADLARALPGCNAVLALDSYYRDYARLSPAEQAAYNFDAPEAIDRPLLVAQLGALARGEAVECPAYDFATHGRLPGGVLLVPGDHVVVEGLFALLWAEVRRLYGASFYVHAAEEVCLRRRLARDTVERRRSRDSVVMQYESQVRPMCRQHVLPTRFLADAVVDGTAPAAASVRAMLEIVQSRAAAAGRDP